MIQLFHAVISICPKNLEQNEVPGSSQYYKCCITETDSKGKEDVLILSAMVSSQLWKTEMCKMINELINKVKSMSLISHLHRDIRTLKKKAKNIKIISHINSLSCHGVYQRLVSLSPLLSSQLSLSLCHPLSPLLFLSFLFKGRSLLKAQQGIKSLEIIRGRDEENSLQLTWRLT